MDPEPDLPTGFELAALRGVLRDGGAVFAFLHGSQVDGSRRAGSDVDVAAWFAEHDPVHEVEVASRLPVDADLLVLNSAPLELAGRVAMRGVLLLDDDPPTRVAWQAQTRKIFLDELPRAEQAARDFSAALRRG